MIKSARAVAFAAAAFLFAAVFPEGAALIAATDEAAAPVAHYLDHADAAGAAADLGLNVDQPIIAPVSAVVGTLTQQGRTAVQPQRSLAALIIDHSAAATSGAEQHCLASAIYFEARGESVEGQLAVAEVVLNRTRSGRYPATICEVVRQPAQFSFVRRGVIPRADPNCDHWRRGIAIARIAESRTTRLLPENVLWYHANYVAPSWGRRLARNRQIGAHIFYS
jgi:spore germination cell wall hydrolase CwlJ-like protein